MSHEPGRAKEDQKGAGASKRLLGFEDTGPLAVVHPGLDDSDVRRRKGQSHGRSTQAEKPDHDSIDYPGQRHTSCKAIRSKRGYEESKALFEAGEPLV